MLQTKQEIDDHAAQVLNNTVNEKERNLRYYTIANSYYRIREYETAKRYLQTYLNLNPDADGFKFMGDILSLTGEEKEALEFYKNCYELTKQLPVLDRICDLLHTEAGETESEETKERWFGLQKSASSRPISSWMPPSTTKGGTVFNSSGIQSPSPALPPPSRELFGPPKTKIALNLMNGIANDTSNTSPKTVSNAQIQAGDSPTSRLNQFYLFPEAIDIQERYMERTNDEIMTKLVEQNCKIYNQLTSLTDEFKDFRDATQRNLSKLSVRIGRQESSGRSSIPVRPANEFRGSLNSSVNHAGLAAQSPPHFGYHQLPNQSRGLYPTQMFIPQTAPDLMNFTNPYYASLSAMYTGAANLLPRSGDARYLSVSPLQQRIGYAQQFKNVGSSPAANTQNFQNNSSLSTGGSQSGSPAPIGALPKNQPVQKLAQQQQIIQARAKHEPIQNNATNFSWTPTFTSPPDTKTGSAFSSEPFKFGDFDGYQFSIPTQSTVTALAKSGDDEQVQWDGDEVTSESYLSIQGPKVDQSNQIFKQIEDGVWECPDCYLINKNFQLECQACCTGKPGSQAPCKEPNTAPNPSFSFPTKLNEQTNAFTFGINSASLANYDACVKNSATFQLQVAESYQLGASPVVTSKPDMTTHFSRAAPEGAAADSEGYQQNDEEEDEFVPTAEFAPVIPLPPLVEQKTGDEDEIVVHQGRAKLFRFDSLSKEWKERGIGDIKIMQEKSAPSKARVLMWREQVQKIACNHRILPELSVSYHKQDLKTLTWVATDFSEGSERPEVFVSKFGNEKSCADFKTALENMVKVVSCATEKSEEATGDNILNDTTCPGCDGCEPDKFDFSKLENRQLPTYAHQSTTPEQILQQSSYNTQQGLQLISQSPNAGDVQSLTTWADKSKQELKNIASTGSFPRVKLFQSPSEETMPPISETIFSSYRVENNEDARRNDIPPNVNPFESIRIQSATGFGDLVKQGEVSGFSGGMKPFASTGTTVFGGRFTLPNPETVAQRNSNEDPEKTEEGEAEFVPTAEFTPVIPLPPLVQVKKGDEEETVIYEVRVKLFRLDSAAKEWKERGVGNMKILQDKADPTKVRLLMWRDQVQKVACNHRVLPGLTVSPHMNSTKALKWSANDFSEGIEKPEVFSCKFANEKLCEEFKSHLEKMVAFLENEESRAIATKPDFNASTVENLLYQADASSPQYSTDQAKTCGQSESESEEDDNDDDEEDDEILFEGKIKLFIKNVHDNDFKDLGDGTGHIYYDTETCVSRFSFTSSDGEIAVDHCIVGDTDLEATGSLSYTWNAINETVSEYGKCQLQASFLDTECFGEFWVRMSESSYEADAAGITEQYLINQLGIQ